MQGVKGIPCIWHVAPELVDRFQLPPDVPESITDRVDRHAHTCCLTYAGVQAQFQVHRQADT